MYKYHEVSGIHSNQIRGCLLNTPSSLSGTCEANYCANPSVIVTAMHKQGQLLIKTTSQTFNAAMNTWRWQLAANTLCFKTHATERNK